MSEEATKLVIAFLNDNGITTEITDDDGWTARIRIYVGTPHLGDLYILKDLKIEYQYSAYSSQTYDLHEPDSLDRLLDKMLYERARLDYFRECQ